MRVMDTMWWMSFPFPRFRPSAASTIGGLLSLMSLVPSFCAVFRSRKFPSAPELISAERGETCLSAISEFPK